MMAAALTWLRGSHGWTPAGSWVRSSERTDAFLRDGGVARAEPVLSGLRPSSAMAVWPGRSQF